MWFYPIIGLLIVLALIGGIVAGGVFTLVLVPLAFVAAFTGVAIMAMARGEREKTGAAGGADRGDPPLPHAEPSESGHHLARPEELTDARRAAQ